MPISVTCSSCQKTFRVTDNFAGKQGRCPQCNAVLNVPTSSESNSEKPAWDAPPPPPLPSRDRERNRERGRDRELPDNRGSRRPRYREFVDHDRIDDEDWARGRRSWRLAAGGIGLMIADSITSLASRAGFLIATLMIIFSDPFRGQSNIRMAGVILLISLLPFLTGCLLGMIGRLSTRYAPDDLARTNGWISFILNAVALGCYVVAGLMFLLLIAADGGRSPRDAESSAILIAILGTAGLFTAYTCEILYGRFIGRIGNLARNRGLYGWQSTLMIYYCSLLGLALVTITMSLARVSAELTVILNVVFIALDAGGVVMSFLPRLRLSNAMRELHFDSEDRRQDERDAELDEDSATPSRSRRRYRDEEDDE